MTQGRVDLLNVPYYGQGAFDSLCMYYTGAMMLAALHPEYAAEFGKSWGRSSKYMSADPIIMHYGGDEDHRKVLARWFYQGEHVKKMVEILNRIMRWEEKPTKFKLREMDRRGDKTYHEIASRIDDGLPVMLSWDTEDYGIHAVLVVGYWVGKEKWLVVNDPGQGPGTEISWGSIKLQQEGRGKFKIGDCVKHGGLRPLKTVWDEDVAIVHQWSPSEEWVALDKLFK